MTKDMFLRNESRKKPLQPLDKVDELLRLLEAVVFITQL